MSGASDLGLPPGIRCCLFDLDGVLTRTARTHAAAWKAIFDDHLARWAERAGAVFVPFDAERDYARYVDGRMRRDGVRSFLAARGISAPDADLDELAERKNAAFLDRISSEGVEIYPDAVRYVSDVRSAGLPVAIVSSSANARLVIEAAGLPALADVIVDGRLAAQRGWAGKPAPDTYLAAAGLLGAEAAGAAVFEDAVAGVRAARAGAFALVVGVDRVGQEGALWQAGAHVVVSELGLLRQ